MSKYILKYDNNYDIYADYIRNEKTKTIDSKDFNVLYDMIISYPILNISFKDNTLIINYQNDSIVIPEYDLFSTDKRLEKLNLQIDSFIEEKNKENRQKIKNQKPKIKKDKSIAFTGMKAFTFALVIAGVIIVNHDYDRNDFIKNEEKEEIVAELPEFRTIPFPSPNKVYSKQEFNEILLNYAISNEVDLELFYPIMLNNNELSDTKLEYYKTIIDYMVEMKNNKYKLELITSDKQALVAIHKNGRFIVIPTNDKNLNSLVQINPNYGSNSTTTYSHYLDMIRYGNIPNCILIGSGDSVVNTIDTSVLEKIVELGKKTGIDIQNIGFIGYQDSSLKGLISAGDLLAKYPNLNIRIVNINTNDIGKFCELANNTLSNSEGDFQEEVKALLSSNVEITNILPFYNEDEKHNSRVDSILAQHKDLSSYIFNTNLIATTNTLELQNEAYNMRVLDYLSGKITREELIGNRYFIPELELKDGNLVYSTKEKNIN